MRQTLERKGTLVTKATSKEEMTEIIKYLSNKHGT